MHIEVDLDFVIRGLLFLMALYLFLRLWLVRRRKWKIGYTHKEKASWNAFFIADITILVGSLENIIQENSLGVRTVLSFFTVFAIILVTHTADDRQYVIDTDVKE